MLPGIVPNFMEIQGLGSASSVPNFIVFAAREDCLHTYLSSGAKKKNRKKKKKNTKKIRQVSQTRISGTAGATYSKFGM